MTRETAPGHQRVRSYLRDLDFALGSLPYGQARELREQIAAHLNETLSAGSDDQEVAEALRRLGSPSQLAMEAAVAAGPRTSGQRALSRLRRLRWRGWALITALVAATSYVIVMMTAAPLDGPGGSRWWYPRDVARQVETSAGGLQQTTVPIRSGQRQGFAVTVYNPGPWTQTILGFAADQGSPGGPDYQLGVTTTDPYHGGGDFTKLRYALPVSVPPHQSRWLRVMWTSTACMDGGYGSIDTLSLRVRVGWIPRTETIPLRMAWALAGPSQPATRQDGNCAGVPSKSPAP